MTDRIRFHLDENVDPAVASALRQYGIDASTTVGEGLRGQPDDAQWAFAREERRVLVTHDADFLRRAAASSDHAGIAFCGQTDRSIGQVVRSLVLIYEVLSPAEIAGRVEYL